MLSMQVMLNTILPRMEIKLSNTWFRCEWIVMCVEPAKELTCMKEPGSMFLQKKDFCFRAISIDLHQAIFIDQ